MASEKLSGGKPAILRFLISLRFALVETPRWLLLAAVVYAPWAYGCTRWWTKTLLIQSLLAITFLWLCSLFLRRRWPRVSVPAVVLALSLLGLGWLSVFNSLATYDELAQVFSPVSQPLQGWLGSWDAEFARRAMLLVTALTGAFLISMDFAANPVWRARLFFTLALSGGLLLVLGLAQRAGGAPGIFWEASAPKGNFFATYVNHSNAGAFINLTLPIVAGQTILAFQNTKGQFARALWSFLLIVSVTALFVNTSRASMVIGLVIIGALVIGTIVFAVRRRPPLLGTREGGEQRRQRAGKREVHPGHREAYPQRFVPEGRLPRPRVLATAAVVLVCTLILILSFGIERSLERWNHTLNSLFVSDDGAPSEGRVSIYRICWLSLPAAGWFGFGPGTFSIVFPFLQQEHGGELNGILRYAHQDYLQTILEWGVIGFVLWAVLIGGGIVRAIFQLREATRAITREPAMWLALSALSLIGALIHGLVDFPLQIASLQLIFAVLLGQLWADLYVDRQRTRSIRLGTYASLRSNRANREGSGKACPPHEQWRE